MTTTATWQAGVAWANVSEQRSKACCGLNAGQNAALMQCWGQNFAHKACCQLRKSTKKAYLFEQEVVNGERRVQQQRRQELQSNTTVHSEPR